MKRLKVEVIAEKASGPVEGDGFPTWVVENTEAIRTQRKHASALNQHGREYIDA